MHKFIKQDAVISRKLNWGEMGLFVEYPNIFQLALCPLNSGLVVDLDRWYQNQEVPSLSPAIAQEIHPILLYFNP